MSNIRNFTAYLNDFYGPNGLHPTKGRSTPITVDEVSVAVLLASDRGHTFCGGDTFDREEIRDILIETGIINPFPVTPNSIYI